MMLSLWVFFLVGDSLVEGEAPAYEQQISSAHAHRVSPRTIEAACRRKFAERHPHHIICDSGWCRQEVKVNPV